MLESAHRRWLRSQLPVLVEEGVLPQEAAERLRARYPADEDGAGRRIVVVLFGVLGALFIGGGVILLLAHNWEALTRPVRAVLSLAPLAGSIAAATWVVAADRTAAWREGIATLWMLSIGASIALISQTYNLPGSWTAFLLTWLLLAVPIPYVLRSPTAALLYLLGLAAWVPSSHFGPGAPVLFWPLLALLGPFVVDRLRSRPAAASSEALTWFVALTTAVGLGASLEPLDDLWGPHFVGGCLALWAAAKIGHSRRWQRPLRLVGGLGVLGGSLVLSFADPWPRRVLEEADDLLTWDALVVLAVGLGAAALVVLAWRRDRRALTLGAALPVVWVGLALALHVDEAVAAVLLNLYLLATGVALLVQGTRADSLGRANAGAALVGLLVLLRFFDTDWGFLVRGAAFIAVGLALLLVNVALLRRREAP